MLLGHEREAMLEVIRRRNITELCHFTRVSNCESIMKHGLYSRAYLESSNVLSAEYSDEMRLDGHIDAISLSVSFPNYKMFYIKRNENLDVTWCVLSISPKVLIDCRCKFSWMNAASSEMRDYIAHSDGRSGDFERLFQDYGKYKRDDIWKRMPDNYTTNPQAEVLVFDHIDCKYIQDVQYNGNFFRYRDDYEYWKQISE